MHGKETKAPNRNAATEGKPRFINSLFGVLKKDKHTQRETDNSCY